MTTAELRTVALTVKQRIQAMHADISPAYNEVETWVLNGADSSLPTIGEVKAALLAYEAFEKPSLLLYEEVRTLKMTADSAAALPDSAEFAPLAHRHFKADISDFTVNLKQTAEIYWMGNGEASRVLSVPFQIITGNTLSCGETAYTQGCGMLRDVGYQVFWRQNGTYTPYAFTSTPTTITILLTDLNTAGVYYYLVMRGDF